MNVVVEGRDVTVGNETRASSTGRFELLGTRNAFTTLENPWASMKSRYAD